MSDLYPSNRPCWVSYARQIKDFYAKTYASKNNAMRDAQFAEECIVWLFDCPTMYPTVGEASTAFYQKMQSVGSTTYAAGTCKLYFENTINSYLERCTTETGGFTPDVACWKDEDCPRGYRCRGIGTASECIYSPETTPPPPPPPESPSGDCPRGRQYQAPLIGGCDPGYYREKSWGRDMCVCEAGASAETSWDKLGDYLTGNLKMVLIVIVVIVLSMVVIKVASKKVSVG